MNHTMLYKDIVKPGMEENVKKYIEIIANLRAQKVVEEKIAKGVKELETKRAEEEA